MTSTITKHGQLAYAGASNVHSNPLKEFLKVWVIVNRSCLCLPRNACSQMLMVMTNTILWIHPPATAVTDPTHTTLILPKLTSSVLSRAFHRLTRTTLMAYAIQRRQPEHQYSFQHSRSKRMREHDPRRKGRCSTTRTSTRVRRC